MEDYIQTAGSFEPGDTVTAAGYRGAAWRVEGPHLEWTEEEWIFDPDPELTAQHPEVEPEEIEGNYLYVEPERVPDGRIDAHMVGDDRTFTFDPKDLTPLEEDEYCPGCGQIGCHAYG